MVDEEADRFYKLNDDLLCHIMDLLPTKDALGTSVLSSRWRYLWRCISNIDLNDISFPSRKYDESSFLDSIDRMLVHHDSSEIKRFVSCKGRYDPARIHLWISEVIKHNVQELHINCSKYSVKPSILPVSLFKSESLTVLKIDMDMNSYSIILGSDSSLFSVHLPNLKILKLAGVIFLNNHSTQQFFSNIPKLQQLYLHGCNWEKVNRLIIDIPTLEEVDVCILARHKLDCQVTVIAPNLTDFICKTDFSIDFLLSRSSHSWSLNVFLDGDCLGDDDDFPDRFALIRLLECVKKLVSLHVTWEFSKWLKVKGIDARDLPLFMNLKHLKISTYLCSYGDVNLNKIVTFLHKTPNLQTFTITLPDKYNDDWERFGWHFEHDWFNGDVPSCVINQIKTFSISSESDIYSFVNGLSVYSTVMDLINYVMNHSLSLETLEVSWSCYSPSPTRDIMEEIERHPRYSELKSFSCSNHGFFK